MAEKKLQVSHKIAYKTILYKINVKNIKLFKFLENRRAIREAYVSRIHGMLQRGEHFDAPLVVNKSNGFYRIIDGNHRIEALNRFYSYKVNSTKEVEVILSIYDNLSEEEEKRVYTQWNSGTPENREDRLQIHKDDIVFWKKLKDDFPCAVNIYPSKNGVQFRFLLNMLATVNSKSENFRTARLRKEELVGFADSVLYTDYLDLKAFMNFFQEVFGVFESQNPYTKSNIFYPLAHIYYTNKVNFSVQELANRFSLVRNRASILGGLNVRGEEQKREIRRMMLEYMNKGRATKKLI